MNKNIQIVLTSLILLTGCAGNMANLGVKNGKMMQCPETPNCVNSQAKDKKHSIDPIRVKSSAVETKEHILKILKGSKRAKIVVVEDDYIRAEFTSMLFRFVDDVEFYFPETGSKEMLIHIRSVSRVGHTDFGVNRKRIEQIRNDLKAIGVE